MHRVNVELKDGIYTLTLNRPEKRNAIDVATIQDILNYLEKADLDPEVRVVALRGAGKDFCAGMDLDDLLASAERSIDENTRSALHFGSIFTRMRDIPKPVVAIVQGRCLAGGMGLATGCDMILAHPSAMFGYPEIQRGFVPAIVMAMLRRALGEKLAFDLVATGRLLWAEEALKSDLISRVLSADKFETEISELLGQLSTASVSAMALTKRQFYAIEGKSFPDAIRLGADVNALARNTPDFRKSIAQFLKK
jgi:methylglutaconyl-CoA hydratase